MDVIQQCPRRVIDVHLPCVGRPIVWNHSLISSLQVAQGVIGKSFLFSFCDNDLTRKESLSVNRLLRKLLTLRLEAVHAPLSVSRSFYPDICSTC